MKILSRALALVACCAVIAAIAGCGEPANNMTKQEAEAKYKGTLGNAPGVGGGPPSGAGGTPNAPK